MYLESLGKNPTNYISFSDPVPPLLTTVPTEKPHFRYDIKRQEKDTLSVSERLILFPPEAERLPAVSLPLCLNLNTVLIGEGRHRSRWYFW